MERITRREFVKLGIALTGAAAAASIPEGLNDILPAERDYALESCNSMFVELDKGMGKPHMRFRCEEGVRLFEMTYPVVIGLEEHPTLPGSFEVDEIVLKPDWYPPKYEDGEYFKWVRQKQRKIADENGGFIPYGHKQNPLGEFKIKLRDLKTGKTVYQMIHGNGGYWIKRGIWMNSHGCMKMRDEDGLEMIGHIHGRFPVTIDRLYV
jgi:hypothetical protein